MTQRVQTKPFERWIGQTVYREVHPTHGPYANKTVAVRRGVIKDIYPFQRYPLLHETHFEVDIVWWTLEVKTTPIPEGFRMHPGPKEHNYHPRVEAPFDYGLCTLFEYDLLVRGALLGKDGPTWDEPQSEHLIEMLPLYQRILDNPDAPYIIFEEKINE